MGIDFQQIKALREGRQLTQQEAARLAGLSSRAMWNEIENGKRSNVTVDTLEKVAVALGVKAKDLLK